MSRLVIHLFLLGTCVATASGTQQTAESAVAWPDSKPLTKRSVVVSLAAGNFVRIDVLGPQLFRIRRSETGKWTESALNRYGILADHFPPVAFTQKKTDAARVLKTKAAQLTVMRKDGAIILASLEGKVLTRQTMPEGRGGKGYSIRFSLTEHERIYGLGDVSRENIMRRGGTYELWVRNVKSYIPIPVLLSDRGWGLLVNTTWRNTIDVGKRDPDAIVCAAAHGNWDCYLFCGPDYRSMLDTYTKLSGRPALLPIWAYGFTYVCNEHVDAFRMIDEAMTFRRERMPCDVIGLEPGWMSKHYDFSTAKQWHPERFPMPKWASRGPHTFIGALQRKGFKLSLWLCCDYDLSVYEERQLAGGGPTAAAPIQRAAPRGDADDFEKDEHLNKPEAIKPGADKQKAKPQEAEPWFKHLEKFVDQGVQAFKLDGANQVLEHPRRKWGNGMTDEEMHNLYPVIYAKQMARGFERHTGRRAMVYSAAGYAGVQQFVASWAGDTGGGPKPLASMLNLGFSGHSNHSCDMDVFSTEGIHFGFLQTWAQLNNWAYWRQPWLLEDAQIATFRRYAQLRYRLLPYLYSTAAQAAQTGYPVMRAMALVYPDDPAWDHRLGQYMLGDFLLVSVFSKDVQLPRGAWTDFWTGKRVVGPAVVPVKVDAEHGGALLVKSGAIIPTWPRRSHVDQGWSPQVGLLVYPSAHSTFTLYEDDGTSLGYRQGQFAHTRLVCEKTGNVVTLTIGGREGRFAGMPATRDFVATIHLAKPPESVTLDGMPLVDCRWDAPTSSVVVNIPACGKTPRVVVCR